MKLCVCNVRVDIILVGVTVLRVREKDAKFVIRITHYCVLAATRDTIWLLINVYYVP